MEEVKTTATYAEFKKTLDQEILAMEEGFVKIGYLLKIARDTNILYESGYNSMAEFAWAEYHLDDSATSRFIAINDRYSENGYSDKLQERYKGYGVSKLSEMLTLPQQIADNIPQEITRADIRLIKKEVAEENKITDLELMLEKQPEKNKSLVEMAIRQYFYDHRDQFVEVSPVIGTKEFDDFVGKMMDVLAPSGMSVLMTRVSGVGKLMITIKGKSNPWIVQNIRSMEQEECSWVDVLYAANAVYEGIPMENPKEAWQQAYGEVYEDKHEPAKELEQHTVGTGKAEKRKVDSKPARKTAEPAGKKKEQPPIAPAQKTEKKTKENVVNTESESNSENQEKELKNHIGEATDMVKESTRQQEEDKIPGQDNVMNHPELLPEGMQTTTATINGHEQEATVEPTAAQRVEECLSLLSCIQGNLALQNYPPALKQAQKLLEHLEALI